MCPRSPLTPQLPLSTDWPEGYARKVLTRTDSTNAEAARIAPTLTQPTWVLALEQSAARGRRGRAWVMPKGNFAGTLVMRPAEAPEVVALRSFVTSLALYDALVAVTGRPEAFWRWKIQQQPDQKANTSQYPIPQQQTIHRVG